MTLFRFHLSLGDVIYPGFAGSNLISNQNVPLFHVAVNFKSGACVGSDFHLCLIFFMT